MAAPSINSKIKLDGEREYKAALAEIKSGLNVLKSELNLASEQFRDNADSVEALAALWAQHPAKIAAMAHGGVRGNPCLFPARFYPELLALNGDRGGSAVIRNHEADLILLETDALELTDIDTPEALKQAGSAG